MSGIGLSFLSSVKCERSHYAFFFYWWLPSCHTASVPSTDWFLDALRGKALVCFYQRIFPFIKLLRWTVLCSATIFLNLREYSTSSRHYDSNFHVGNNNSCFCNSAGTIPLDFFTIHRTFLWNYYFTMFSAQKAGNCPIFQILNYVHNCIHFKTKASGRKRQLGNWKTDLPVHQQATVVILSYWFWATAANCWACVIWNLHIVKQAVWPCSARLALAEGPCLTGHKDFSKCKAQTG